MMTSHRKWPSLQEGGRAAA